MRKLPKPINQTINLNLKFRTSNKLKLYILIKRSLMLFHLASINSLRWQRNYVLKWRCFSISEQLDDCVDGWK